MSRYYEDLAVGDTYECGSQTVTKPEIVDFAEQFDPQPFHTDEAAAAESMFGRLVASGLHTLCLSTRLAVTNFYRGEPPLANEGGLGRDALRWHEPVYPGDTLGLELEVVGREPSDGRADRGYVDFRRSLSTPEAEVLSVVTHVIVRRSGAGE